jgi:hypothetical protein
VAKCLWAALFVLVAHSAFGQVKLNGLASPPGGISGVDSVGVIGSPFPSGMINPANVVVSIARSCGGTAVARTHATSVAAAQGSAMQVTFTIPPSLATGTYYVTITDDHDTRFTTITGSCSELHVLSACGGGGAIGVLLPKGGRGNVIAYVPGDAEQAGVFGSQGIFVQNIEGFPGPNAKISAAEPVSACSSNPATGQTVCTGRDQVYVVAGTTVNKTLSDGFSGFIVGFGSFICDTCGVATNAANNTAVINGSIGGGIVDAGGLPAVSSGVQVLDLNTNTSGPVFPMNDVVSENIFVDPGRNLVLSASFFGGFDLLKFRPSGALQEFDSSFSVASLGVGSTAEDCSTGIGIAPQGNAVGLVNLNAPASGAGVYAAPFSSPVFSTNYALSVASGAAAQGPDHLAVAAGNTGTFAVLELPATAGNGAPSVVDYAVAAIPHSDACGTFTGLNNPNMLTAYTSPNTGHSYAVLAGYAPFSSQIGPPICLAVVDLDVVINPALSKRGGAGYSANDVAPANLPRSAITFFPLH